MADETSNKFMLQASAKAATDPSSLAKDPCVSPEQRTQGAEASTFKLQHIFVAKVGTLQACGEVSVVQASKNKNELRLFLVGPTGAGKSSAGNTILNDQVFEVQVSMSSTTYRPASRTGKEGDTELTVMDTPGFFDTEVPNKETAKLIVDAFRNLHPGPHAILFTIPINSKLPQDFKAFQRLTQYFGEDILSYTIILLTHGDEIGRYDVEEYLKNAPPELNEMIKSCENRFVLFNNQNCADRSQVQRLLQKISEFRNLHYCCAKDLSRSQFAEDFNAFERQKLEEELAETKKHLAQQEELRAFERQKLEEELAETKKHLAQQEEQRAFERQKLEEELAETKKHLAQQEEKCKRLEDLELEMLAAKLNTSAI